MCTKVTIVVPVYNVEKYLDRCMCSLLNQTLQDIEIILVDDGSLDNCPKMCDNYAEQDLRVKVVHKKNEGLGLARNSGIKIATGQYVAFVDSDDFIELAAFEEMYNACMKNNAQMCMTGYYKYNTKNKVKEKVVLFDENQVFSSEQVNDIAYKMLGSPPDQLSDEYYGMSVWKNLYDLNFLRENDINFFSEREYVSEDAIFHLCAVPKMKRIFVLQKCYYYYCDNNDKTLTSTYKDSKFHQYKTLYLKELEMIKQIEKNELGKLCATRMFLGNVRAHIKQLSNSGNPFTSQYKKTKDICNDELLQQVLSWYPYKKNPTAQRIFSIMLKYKVVLLCLVFAKLQANVIN